jgi:hypothetical protein
MENRTLSVALIGLFWASKRRPWFVIVGGTACFALAGRAKAHTTNSAATIAITCQTLRILMSRLGEPRSGYGAALAAVNRLPAGRR